MASRSTDLRVRIDAEFPGERGFRSAEASARALARELDRVDAAARAHAAAEAAAYREAEQAAAAHEASVRRMAAAEASAYRQAAQEAEQAADRQRKAMEAVGSVLLAGGAIAAAGVGLAVSAFADFDVAMSTVAADTHETAGNLGLMREAALAAGKDTKFSATEAAGAIDELAKAGVSTADILAGGLSGALSLAAAGGLDVAEAAETAATAMVQFGLSGDQVGHVADLLAAGAGKAQGSVSDLGAALKQGGLVASQFGISVEDTTGTLAAFASAGLVGSDAGTSMKTMLLALANPSVAAKNRMAELGIAAYDASGQFVGMTGLAGQLQTKLSGLTQAQRDQSLAMIFGTDAIRSANVLYTQGADGIQGWIDQTDDAGYAAVTAATKMDNLKGDVELLTGSFQTAMISSGSAGDDFLRQQVQSVTAVVDAYNNLPEPVQRAALGVGASGAAAALAAGAFLTFGPRVLDLTKSMRDLNADGSRVPGTLKNIAKGAAVLIALSAAGAALSTYSQASMEAVQSSSEATAMLASSSTDIATIDAQVRKLGEGGTVGFSSLADGLKNLADPSLVDRLNDTSAAALSFTGLYSASGRPERAAFIEQLSAMGEGLSSLASNGAGDLAAQQFAAIGEQAAAAGISQEQLLDLMPAYRDALAEQDTQQTLAAQSGEQMAAAITGMLPPTETAEEAIEKLSDGLESMLSQFFSVDEASDAYASSLLDIAGAAEQNGKAVEGNTAGAIANRAAMRDSAETATDLLVAMAKQGAGSDELAAKAAQLKAEFVAQATAAGFTGAEVDKVVAAYDAMPALVQTKVIAEGLAGVVSATAAFRKELDKIDGRTVTTVIQTKTGNLVGQRAGLTTMQADGSVLDFYADGGVREDHVAQIAPAGAWRVWAEEETGGEAYIPLADGKRSRSKSIVEQVVSRFGGDVEWYADGGISGSAGAVVSKALISSALVATTGPVDGTRYAAALDASTRSAQAAASAEQVLNGVRAAGEKQLARMKKIMEANAQGLKDQQDAAEEALAAALDALKDRNTEAERALKDSHAEAERALKERNTDELDAFRARSKDQAAVKALQRRQEQAERDLERRNADAERAQSARHESDEEAAQSRITAAKKANTEASGDLAAANDRAYDARKAQTAEREAAAEENLTAAKDAATLAAEELSEAERQLNEARQRAVDLAKQVASALMGNAGLDRLFGDTSAADLTATATALERASAAVDAASRTVRGEDASATLSRRSQSLGELVSSATAYAAAQEAMGVSDATIGAGLDQVRAKVADLGAAYGLTAEQVADLTASLQSQRTSGADVLASRQRELARATEQAAAVKSLMAAGLDASLVEEIAGDGTSGLALARSILAGGADLVAAFNANQAALVAVSNDLGATIADARYGATTGGSIAGYGTALGFTTGQTIASSVSLDPATQALLQRVLTAVTTRPNVVSLDSKVLATAMNQVNSDAAYGTAP